MQDPIQKNEKYNNFIKIIDNIDSIIVYFKTAGYWSSGLYKYDSADCTVSRFFNEWKMVENFCLPITQAPKSSANHNHSETIKEWNEWLKPLVEHLTIIYHDVLIR